MQVVRLKVDDVINLDELINKIQSIYGDKQVELIVSGSYNSDTTPNLAYMLRTADEFLTISHNNLTYIPNLVNAAFACEIFLKYINYCKHKNYKNGHNLQTLYKKAVNSNALDEQAFLKILSNQIADSGKSDDDKASIFEYVRNDREHAKEILNDVLDRHGTVFEDWRYGFEGKCEEMKSFDRFFFSFAKALREYCKLIDEYEIYLLT